MRTPNTECAICNKPLYRRPFEFKKARYFACNDCRETAKKKAPVTNKQKESLKLGRTKGDNHLTGIPKSKESNIKRSKTHKKFWKENPEKLAERAKKTRGANHYRWKGGVTKLNRSIRQMTENRNWQKAIKERDKHCMSCGSKNELEAHHIVSIAEIIEKNGIKNRQDARKCKELWNLDNGVTYCKKCHYKKHGRRYENR